MSPQPIPTTIAVPTVGDAITDFDLLAADGSASTLHEQISTEGAVVYFMRSATCPVCNAHVKALGRMHQGGELSGVPVIVVVPGTAAEASVVGTRHTSTGLHFWASESAHERMGLQVKMGLQQSGTFVVDRNARVTAAQFSTVPIQSMNAADTRAGASAVGSAK